MGHAQGPVLIAGGGPVGMIAALALARQGVDVVVLEAEAEVDGSPRAATTHPATLEMLADLGLIDEVIRRGLVAPTFQFWDRPSGKLIAQFDHAALDNDTRYPFVVQCEQHKLVKLSAERLRALPNAEIHVASRVCAIELNDNGVALTVESGGRTRD